MRELEKRKILQKLSQRDAYGPEMNIVNEQQPDSSMFSSQEPSVAFEQRQKASPNRRLPATAFNTAANYKEEQPEEKRLNKFISLS